VSKFKLYIQNRPHHLTKWLIVKKHLALLTEEAYKSNKGCRWILKTALGELPYSGQAPLLARSGRGVSSKDITKRGPCSMRATRKMLKNYINKLQQ
jgi:hypothetical protein